MSWLCGRFDLMEKLASAVKDNAQQDLDLANVYQCLIEAYTAQGKLKKAMETGEEILKKLGYKLSHLSPNQWQQTLVQVKSSLAGKSVEEVMRFEQLTQPEAEYRGIFENATEGIYRTSPDGRFLSANPAMAQIFGYSSPEELMASITDVEHQLYVNPEQRNQFLDLMRQRRPV